ncbi:MAG: glycogen synthase GlgA [Candidatus Omnitrophica bacterium]|nr:glycogen synthase GlgA [Candidatus Omnitrophota bacterium]
MNRNQEKKRRPRIRRAAADAGRVVFCASEAAPLAKTGGLADVVGTLPPVLARRGIPVTVFLPLYRQIAAAKCRREKIAAHLYRTPLARGVDCYLIEHNHYFDRAGLYQENGSDYPDNLDRFAFFSLQVLKTVRQLRLQPAVIHCHDWQTALIPLYLKTRYAHDSFFRKVKTILTIHNLGYQGIFPVTEFSKLGLDERFFSLDGLEFYGQINLLKGGLLFADRLTTVSPTYAREIQTIDYGCGLEGVLRQRAHDLTGILNGICPREWDPQRHPALARQYGPDTLRGKLDNKYALQQRCGLPVSAAVPLVAMITRLADQKGLDILSRVMESICRLPVQFVLLGTGEPGYHSYFTALAERFSNISVHLRFDALLAAQVYAGSDIFLMPSRYEPCGLGQLISLRFGTLPIVRSTGGLADTIEDYDPFRGQGTGFVFDAYQSGALLEAVKRALCVYRQPARWKALMQRGMRADFSWEKSAGAYARLYRSVCGQKSPERA